jgi:GxxExxY protein
MNTDEHGWGPDLTHSGNSKLLFKKETEAILGCAFDVLNEVGHGFHEKIYENSLTVAFLAQNIPFDQQRRFPVLFKGRQVGEFIPDLLVFDSVVVDPKVIDQITEHERGQMLNYLRITKKRVGLVLSFKHSRLQWERLVL